jgi:glycosyltransferase involved in cell wall biosynthesis
VDVSVIVPVLNERDSIAPLVEALSAQTLPPLEIVVADGGSTDGTLEVLAGLRARHPGVRIVEGPGGISENRNAAIRAAASEYIACTDAGCVPYPDWLERIADRFAEGADWVASFYRPVGHNLRSTSAGLVIMSVLEEVDPEWFTPAGNSQGFRKTAWERVGGFPEGMIAAEDTLFGERMRAAGFRPVFAGDAVVRWTPPPGILAMARKAYRWGRSDGAAGLRGRIFARLLVIYWGPPALAVLAGLIQPWLALVPLVGLAVVVARRTRFKYRWANGAGRFLIIPLAHLVAIWAQTCGWAVGRGRARLAGLLRSGS